MELGGLALLNSVLCNTSSLVRRPSSVSSIRSASKASSLLTFIKDACPVGLNNPLRTLTTRTVLFHGGFQKIPTEKMFLHASSNAFKAVGVSLIVIPVLISIFVLHQDVGPQPGSTEYGKVSSSIAVNNPSHLPLFLGLIP